MTKRGIPESEGEPHEKDGCHAESEIAWQADFSQRISEGDDQGEECERMGEEEGLKRVHGGG